LLVRSLAALLGQQLDGVAFPPLMNALSQHCSRFALAAVTRVSNQLAALSMPPRLFQPPTKMGKKSGAAKFYAVKCGLQPGIYRTWAECEAKARGCVRASARAPQGARSLSRRTPTAQVKGVRNALHRSFTTLAAAEAYLSDGAPQAAQAGAGAAEPFKPAASSPTRGSAKRPRSDEPPSGKAARRGNHGGSVLSRACEVQEEGTYVLQFDGGARYAPASSAPHSPLPSFCSSWLTHAHSLLLL
jgi:Caulimovirus viroplasmin